MNRIYYQNSSELVNTLIEIGMLNSGTGAQYLKGRRCSIKRDWFLTLLVVYQSQTPDVFHNRVHCIRRGEARAKPGEATKGRLHVVCTYKVPNRFGMAEQFASWFYYYYWRRLGPRVWDSRTIDGGEYQEADKWSTDMQMRFGVEIEDGPYPRIRKIKVNFIL
ncbi:hypothetical protein GE21DRAFT_1268758 [Neurospora crassa]|nr:hypothetical protein GE21DRAFT_1268758 [Neurospora crassa]